MSAWSEDSHFIGRAIVERLREKVPELRSVELIDEMADRDTEPKQIPSAVVILDALRPASTQPVRESFLVDQQWLVVIITSSKSSAVDRIAQKVGTLIPACLSALHGWVPQGTNRPIGWVASPRPNYTARTNLYPLLFRAQLTHGAS